MDFVAIGAAAVLVGIYLFKAEQKSNSYVPSNRPTEYGRLFAEHSGQPQGEVHTFNPATRVLWEAQKACVDHQRTGVIAEVAYVNGVPITTYMSYNGAVAARPGRVSAGDPSFWVMKKFDVLPPPKAKSG